MKVCILGGGLISLTLAKTLVNQGIYVDFILNQKVKNQNRTRTLGISKSNLEFFNKNILNIKKLTWHIKKIEVYSENLANEKILNFENNDQQLFSIIKNYELNDYLISELSKNNYFKFKKQINDSALMKQDYKLIINCDHNNLITKKFFYKKINKNYNSYAHTTIIKHKKINNKIALQIFTKKGPLAFLPISNTETSVVYSARGKKEINLINIIKKHNTKYKISKIHKVSSFELKLSNLRHYHYENILAFGDLLHRLHPLAGQGFNMSIRDIKELMRLIKFKIDHGLDLDNSICLDFEKKIKHKNYLFSKGIDLIYEFFNLESKINNNIFSKSVKFVAKNKITNNFFKRFADNGITI
jgi:2-octaprenyl-6-methoxyphenol hydroxylase